MITLEELNIKINQLKFSTETAEALLAEILDQLNVFEKNHSQQSNDLQMETLNKIHEQITQIKIKENNSENKEVLLMIESLNNHYENLFNKTHKTQITVFGGNNAALNYGRVLLGCGVIFLFYLGFSFLPSYFLQKQELDENYQTLKIYADFKKMYEFSKTGDTKEFDKINRAITNKEEAFLTYYIDLKSHWKKEHEKVELTKQIKEQQEKLKQLSK